MNMAFKHFYRPPWLMRRNRWLGELWDNPVFQRRYMGVKAGRSIGFKVAFMAGAGTSILAIIITFFIDWSSASFHWTEDFPTILGLIDGLVLSIFAFSIAVRLFEFCLIRTPIYISRNFTSENGIALLTSPLKDEEIFFGESLAPLIKILSGAVDVAGLLLGMLIPAVIALVILGYQQSWSVYSVEFIEMLMAITIFFAIGAISYVFYVTTLTFASARLSMNVSPIAAIILAFITTGLFARLFDILAIAIANPLFGVIGIEYDDYMSVGGSALPLFIYQDFRWLIQLIGLGIYTWLMAKAGVIELGRFRRGGRQIY
jgi:hypothetical protein